MHRKPRKLNVGAETATSKSTIQHACLLVKLWWIYLSLRSNIEIIYILKKVFYILCDSTSNRLSSTMGGIRWYVYLFTSLWWHCNNSLISAVKCFLSFLFTNCIFSFSITFKNGLEFKCESYFTIITSCVIAFKILLRPHVLAYRR